MHHLHGEADGAERDEDEARRVHEAPDAQIVGERRRLRCVLGLELVEVVVESKFNQGPGAVTEVDRGGLEVQHGEQPHPTRRSATNPGPPTATTAAHATTVAGTFCSNVTRHRKNGR